MIFKVWTNSGTELHSTRHLNVFAATDSKRGGQQMPQRTDYFYGLHCNDTISKILNKYIPSKWIVWPQSQYTHTCVYERLISSHDLSAYSAAGKYVDRARDYTNRSQAHEYILGTHTVHKWDFMYCSVWFMYCSLWIQNQAIVRNQDAKLSYTLFNIHHF